MDAHIVVARTTDLKGVTSQASATREAPAQAELRPTCAGPSRLNPPLALMGFNPGLNRPAPSASEQNAVSVDLTLLDLEGVADVQTSGVPEGRPA
jgi:hypothetical protein